MKKLYFMALLVATVLGSGCASVKRDRCYLPELRYRAMNVIFEQTGSYQRVAQAMKDEGWAHCEINTFRYRLRKDLDLVGAEYDDLFAEMEPPRKLLEYNPGRVEKTPK